MARHVTRCAVGVLTALACAGCFPTATPNPTGNPRCDRILEQPNELDNGQHYTLRCDPTFTMPPGVIGWTDHKHTTVWLDPTRATDDDTLAMVAFHEYGHVYAHVHGLTDDETTASEIGWCAGGWQLQGVGMPGWGPPPGGCP